MANPFVVVIGNVCSGKSTLVKRFATLYSNWYCLPEDLSANPWLQQNRSVPALQSSIFSMGYYARQHFIASRHPGPVIQESCLQQSSYFPLMLNEIGDISIDGLKTIQLSYSVFLDALPSPDFYIYLYAPSEIRLARAEFRDEPNRSFSKKLIPIMQAKLDDWLQNSIKSSTVLQLDTSIVNLTDGRGSLDEIYAAINSHL